MPATVPAVNERNAFSVLRLGAERLSSAPPLANAKVKGSLRYYYELGYANYLENVYKPQYKSLYPQPGGPISVVGRTKYHQSLWWNPPTTLLGTPGDPAPYFVFRVFNWNFIEDMQLAEYFCPECKVALTVSKGLHHRIVCCSAGQPYIVSARRRSCPACKATFRTFDQSLLAQLPRHIQDHFPAVISDKVALSNRFVTQMNAFHPECKPSLFLKKITNVLAIFHLELNEQYTHALKKVVGDLKSSKIYDRGVHTPQPFPPFLPSEYYLPSPDYLVDSVKIELQKKFSFYVHRMEMITAAFNTLKDDHTFAMPKNVRLGSGAKPFSAQFAQFNGAGQVYSNNLCFTKGNTELLPIYEGTQKRLQAFGDRVDLYFSDSCCSARALLEKTIPMLTSGIPAKKFSTADLPLLCSTSGGCTYEYTLVNGLEHLEAVCGTLLNAPFISIDMEWTPANEIQRDGDGKIAVISLGGEQKNNQQRYTVHIVAMKPFKNVAPLCLVQLLNNFGGSFFGRNVKADFTRFKNQQLHVGVEIMGPSLLLDLGSLAYDLGMKGIDRRNMKLLHLLECLVGYRLDKSLQLSYWDGVISPSQLQYCALDIKSANMIFAVLQTAQKSAALAIPQNATLNLWDNSKKYLIAKARTIDPLPFPLPEAIDVVVTAVLKPGFILPFPVADPRDLTKENTCTSLGDLHDASSGLDFVAKWKSTAVTVLILTPFQLAQEDKAATEQENQESIPRLLTRVKQDCWHFMGRLLKLVLITHPLRNMLASFLRDAFFILNDEDKAREIVLYKKKIQIYRRRNLNIS